MATRQSAKRTLVGTVAAVARFVVVSVFTGVETVVLGIWISFVLDAPIRSRAAAIGLGILVVGLIIEHVLTDLAVNGFDVSFPAGKVAVISASEAALWAVWLVIAERIGGIEGAAVTGVALAVVLVPQHTIEDNVLRGDGLLSRLVDPRTVGFSVIDAAGATAWLALVIREELLASALSTIGIVGVGTDPAVVGLGVLGVALFVEHNIGVGFSRRMSYPTIPSVHRSDKGRRRRPRDREIRISSVGAGCRLGYQVEGRGWHDVTPRIPSSSGIGRRRTRASAHGASKNEDHGELNERGLRSDRRCPGTTVDRTDRGLA